MSSKADEIVEESASEGGAPAAKKNRKKLFIIAGAALALLLVVGGGLYFFLGGAPAAEEEEHGKHGGKEAGKHGAKAKPKAASGGHGGGGGEGEFVDIPPLIVNLRSPDGAVRYLKVHIALVPGTMSGEEIKAALPLAIDAYQPFLRELRPEDLAGSAAVFRVKEELLVRTSDALGEGAVEQVLIQDLLQQ